MYEVGSRVMASRSLSEYIVLLTAALSCLWRTAESDYYPVYGRGSSVFYNASTDSRRFPDVTHTVADSYDYFLSDLNFDVTSGNFISGAADKLYVLNTSDLTEEASLTWESDPTDKSNCELQNSDSPSYTCRNHIRVHQPIPTVTDSTALLVCGTQATKTPQCRVVEVQNNDATAMQGTTLQSFPAVDSSPGIVSYYPGFSQFGEFRQEMNDDTTYFSAGFFEGNSGLGRHFSISYQNITVSDDNTLTTTERFRTISANNNWLRFPVTFVDFLRSDYLPPVNGHDYDYQFYFAFIRENLYSAPTSSDDIIQSRVVRICRNDKGFTPTGMDSNELPYFTTYMKARIFCERQLEPGDQFSGAIKYLYNELRSIAFTAGGRYYGDGDYGKKLYGAFTGPAVGPHGTAICVYDAENTEFGGTGRSQSMFDIFREDLETPDRVQLENNFVACDPEGRSEAEAQNILIHRGKFVSQLGSDPLLVMDGLIVNQMALDQQCVVKEDDSSSCNNQDILFLGTDTGKVVKVVFAGPDNQIFPVVIEEISLDDENNIEKMVIHDEGEERHLFVNTYSKIYKFPLARCSRHESCLDCVSARDPYCVWDGDVGQCVSNPFQADTSGDVAVNSTRYKQNIHSGEAKPHCNLITSSLTYDIIQLEVSCVNTEQVSVAVPGAASLSVTSGTISLTDGRGSTTITGSDGLQSYTVQVMAEPEGIVFTSVVTTPPGSPLSVSSNDILVDSITSTSLRITLNIDKFTDYFIEYSFKIDGGITSNTQLFSVSTSYTVPDLTPATTYTFRVVVMNSVGTVQTEELTVKTLDGVPSAVQNLVSSPTATDVLLIWDDPMTTNGDIIGYAVRVRESGGGGVSVEVRGCGGWGDSIATNYDVMGLTPSTEYVFDVAACTNTGEGPSMPLSTTTLCSSPGPVTNLQFTATTASSLTYSWSTPDTINGEEDRLEYTVVTKCFNEDGAATEERTILETQGSLTGLSPLILCCIQVTAINNCEGQSVHRGPATEVCGETSDVVPGVVRDLIVEGVNREGILATWNLPANYERSGLTYRISVTAPGFSGAVATISDQAFYYLGSLEASQEYTVTVSAESSVGVGAGEAAMNSTLPSPPPPPSNPQLGTKAVSDDVVTLELTWNPVDNATYQVTGYVAVLRCNDNEPMSKLTTNLEVTFDVTNPGANFAWCTAQVQTVSTVGRGHFSDLVSIALPSQAPSTPRCYLVDDQGSTVTISFDVTHPFSLNSLKIRYTLVPDFQVPSSVNEIVETFNANNVLVLPVSRNTKYNFQLRLCNDHGCSEYCDQLRNFTTSSTAPGAPTDCTATDITHNSAILSWKVPEKENASAINYTVQITSSGSGGGVRTLRGHTTSLEFTGLDAETLYSTAIQVTDTRTGTVGRFGCNKMFSTVPGKPSAPVVVEVSWKAEQELLVVSWGIPTVTNGTIRSYEILYAGSIKEDCDNPEGVVMRNNTIPANKRSYETTNTMNIIQSKSIFVCVRAFTDEPGEWAPFSVKDINIGGLGGDESTSNCNGMIVVAIVASLGIILAAVTATVALVLWKFVSKIPVKVGDDRSNESNQSQQSIEAGKQRSPSPSRQSTDTGYDDSQPPSLNKMRSIDSTLSTNTTQHLVVHSSNSLDA